MFPDSFSVADLSLSELRLFDQADLVWLIVVPKKEGIVEVIDLSEAEQNTLWREVAYVSACLKQNFPCDKLNIATLGNVVPTLHVHVIARRFNDAYFPKPPFGVPRISYPVAEREQLIHTLRTLLDETPFGL